LKIALLCKDPHVNAITLTETMGWGRKTKQQWEENIKTEGFVK
jgi:hypothetical protein